MKKTIFVLVVGQLLVATVASYFSYCFGVNNGIKKVIKTENPIDFATCNITGKVDYPLIDIDFNVESEWLVINRMDLFTEREVFNIIQNSQELQFNKEWMRLLTFPVGRGTTPSGIIYVYKDRVLIKEVPCIEVYFENEVFKNAFLQVTKDKVEDILKQKLPPLI